MRLAAMALLAAGMLVGGCGSTSTSHHASADVKAAQAALAPYTGKPQPFPVSAPLARRPTGATVAVMDCGTSVCGLLYNLMVPAARAMGVHLIRYKAGPAVQDVRTAFSAMLAQKPSGVIILPVDLSLITSQLRTLRADKIPVVASGNDIATPQAYGVGAQQAGRPWAQVDGRLMAAWAVATKGGSANVLLENVPGLTFNAALQSAFLSEMKQLCPACTVQQINIPVTALGTTASSQAVAFLQAHPGVNVVAAASAEAFYGLPTALKAAGLHVDLVGNAPAPLNFEDLAHGAEQAGIATDWNMQVWTDIDAIARLITGQAVSPAEASGMSPVQVLTQKDITFNPAVGWTEYSDYRQRFEQLWGVAGR